MTGIIGQRVQGGQLRAVFVLPEGFDELSEIVRGDAERVQDANVRQLSSGAQAVDCRAAKPELSGDFWDREQGVLDPSWTRRFVFLQCGMGDSGIQCWYRSA